jgi:molecular chaperone DnaK (HSP70)
MDKTHKKIFAIDFGTTETVVFCYCNGEVSVVRQQDGNELLPSVVAFQNGKAVVGNAAKEVDGPCFTQLKRIRGRMYLRFVYR